MSVRLSAARLLAVGLLSLPVAMAAPAAKAADLDYGPPESRHGAAYDDPRYRDLYGDDRGPPRYAPPRYAERYSPPPPPDYYPGGSTKDGGYLPPMSGPPRFSEAPRHERHCVPRQVVKDRLRAEGWHDFLDAELRGDVARVKARRPNGRLFALDVDRCTGEIVHARRLGPDFAYDDRRDDRRDYRSDWRGPYAYAPPPRRWSRAY